MSTDNIFAYFFIALQIPRAFRCSEASSMLCSGYCLHIAFRFCEQILKAISEFEVEHIKLFHRYQFTSSPGSSTNGMRINKQQKNFVHYFHLQTFLPGKTAMRNELLIASGKISKFLFAPSRNQKKAKHFPFRIEKRVLCFGEAYEKSLYLLHANRSS